MEDNIQTIIVVIISAFLLFIFPVYMAYEKKDDISYALAMRYTQDLVDEVRSKGYLTKNMYEDYRAKLKLTGNSYDIQMTHEYNRYDPITNYYKIEDGKYKLVKTTTQEEREESELAEIEKAIKLGDLSENPSESDKQKHLKDMYDAQGMVAEDTYQLSQEVYATDHIVNVLNSERKLQLNANSEVVSCKDKEDADDGCQYAYIMNADDNFNITIKNTNITLATVIYNMVTANTLDDNTRIYVNYGGAILSSKWYGDIDYSKMKHDDISLNKFEEAVIFSEERHFYATKEGGVYPVKDTAKVGENDEKPIASYCDGPYVLDFDVKPEEVTELREKGQLRVADYTGYNFAIGNKKSEGENTLSVSVGINGVSLISNVTHKSAVSLEFDLSGYTKKVEIEKTRTREEEYTYINEETGEEETGVRQWTETYVEEIDEQVKITDYSQLRVKYISNGKIGIALKGKTGVEDINVELDVVDSEDILNGLDEIISNPTNTTEVTKYKGIAANKRSTPIRQTISINNNIITISADRKTSEETTILSYPVTINDYTNIRIEIQATEETKNLADDYKKYIANLYIEDEKVEESIIMDVIPKVGVVGKTFIGDEERFFEGYIRNAKIYSSGNN
ncbi:MAG: hypothetical protein IJ272_09170 [Clostridia bacterium]|nr:hypothetical protein [Clostridia bacterium]